MARAREDSARVVPRTLGVGKPTQVSLSHAHWDASCHMLLRTNENAWPDSAAAVRTRLSCMGGCCARTQVVGMVSMVACGQSSPGRAGASPQRKHGGLAISTHTTARVLCGTRSGCLTCLSRARRCCFPPSRTKPEGSTPLRRHPHLVRGRARARSAPWRASLQEGRRAALEGAPRPLGERLE